MKNKLIIVLFILISFSAVSYADNYGMLGKRYLSQGAFAQKNRSFENYGLGYKASLNVPVIKRLDLGINFSHFSIDTLQTVHNPVHSYEELLYTKTNEFELALTFWLLDLWITPFISTAIGLNNIKYEFKDHENKYFYTGLAGLQIQPFKKSFILAYYSLKDTHSFNEEDETYNSNIASIKLGYWASKSLFIMLDYKSDVVENRDEENFSYAISCNFKI